MPEQQRSPSGIIAAVRMTVVTLLLAFLVCLPPARAAAAEPRPAAPWPPPAGRLRVIIDTDAANEIDDQYALALVLGNPDRFAVEGIVAAHFGDAGGHGGIDKSVEETHRVLDKAGLAGRVPVKRGADPIEYLDRPGTSEGVDFIIEAARTATPEQPLWLVMLGPATDGALALLREPKIADRVIMFWHGRSAWPNECLNFNAVNDPKAARLMFSLKCRLVLFDTGTFLTIPPEESEKRFGPLGPLGSYLHEIRGRRPEFRSPKKGVFDLGDIAALVDPACVKFERVEAPTVRQNMRYDFGNPRGPIVRVHDVDRDRSFDLLEEALRRLHRAPPAK
jgi:hypothetical protein